MYKKIQCLKNKLERWYTHVKDTCMTNIKLQQIKLLQIGIINKYINYNFTGDFFLP